MRTMRINGYIILLLGFLWLPICSCKQKPETDDRTTVGGSRFEPGQVWTFHEPTDQLLGATLTVMHIDFGSKERQIINVLVAPVIPDPKLALYHVAAPTNIFLAFSEDALNRSVIALVKTNAAVPSNIWGQFGEAYRVQLGSVKDGIADKCFTNTVGEVLEKRLKQF